MLSSFGWASLVAQTVKRQRSEGSPLEPQMSAAWLTPRFWTSGLQKWERTYFYCFKPTRWGYGVPYQETQETQVRSLGREDPLEKEMATHTSILAWKILWTEGPGRLQSTGSQKVGHNWATNTWERNRSVGYTYIWHKTKKEILPIIKSLRCFFRPKR